MDCRETRNFLTAFHDGELPEEERLRVEDHLRGCPECGGVLADLARADEAARVPDPDPGYWQRFNARLADRIEREAEGPRTATLRPQPGRMRQQLRLLVPAAAAAVLVVAIVRYGGLGPFAPEQVSRVPAVAEKEGTAPITTPAPKEAAGDRIPSTVYRGAPAAERSKPEAERAEAKKLEKTAPASAETVMDAKEEPAPVKETGTDRLGVTQSAATAGKAAGKTAAKAESPCEIARALAAKGRWKEAEAAQRECLAKDQSTAAQEKGLVFLAELLDRQARFAEADAVLAETHRQFPESRSLDLYRQQRPTVQMRQGPVPASR